MVCLSVKSGKRTSGTLNGIVDNLACAFVVLLNANLNLHTDQLMALLPTSKNVQQCINLWASGTWTSDTLNGV